MKRTNAGNMPRARWLAIAAATAAISACGGGGGGGGGGFPLLPSAPAPAPAPAQPPAPLADTSAPCFNEADFHEGTILDFEAQKPGADPSTAFKRKSVTGGREAFAGANPVAFTVGSELIESPYFRQETVKKEYRDLVNGSILIHGKSTSYKSKSELPPGVTMPPGLVSLENETYVSQVFSPPFSFPVDMKPGQVTSQQSSVMKTSVFNGRTDPTTSLSATGELTYHGREKLETPLGTFDTCKFSLKITVGTAPLTKVVVGEIWQAAEGPYRGQMLKGIDPKSPRLATKMTYSPK